MRISRMLLASALVVGVAACAGGEEGAEDDVQVTEEIVTEPGTEEVEVEVPTVDTSVVRTEVDVDTTVDVDVDREVIEDPEIEGENP